jgi:hypothetical protein
MLFEPRTRIVRKVEPAENDVMQIYFVMLLVFGVLAVIVWSILSGAETSDPDSSPDFGLDDGGDGGD